MRELEGSPITEEDVRMMRYMKRNPYVMTLLVVMYVCITALLFKFAE